MTGHVAPRMTRSAVEPSKPRSNSALAMNVHDEQIRADFFNDIQNLSVRLTGLHAGFNRTTFSWIAGQPILQFLPSLFWWLL